MNNTTKNLMFEISKASPIFLLLVAALSFVCIMIFKVDYYAHIYNVRFSYWVAAVVGFVIALIAEGGRFALMVASVEDVRQGKGFRAFLGFIASLGLIGYDIYISFNLGAIWDSSNDVYTNVIIFLVVIGGVLELRLCLLMSKSTKNTPEEKKKDQVLTGSAKNALPFLHNFGLKQNSNLNTKDTASSAT